MPELLRSKTRFWDFLHTHQYYCSIHHDSMTKEAYWASFGKTYRPAHFYELLEKPDYDKARQGIQATIKYKPVKKK